MGSAAIAALGSIGSSVASSAINNAMKDDPQSNPVSVPIPQAPNLPVHSNNQNLQSLAQQLMQG